MEIFGPSCNIAVIGAGMAGAACANALALAGHSVHVFDKSRGPGGRLATRRLEWVDRQGRIGTARLDHGAVGFTARSAEFRDFAEQAMQAGWLAEWTPTLAPGSSPLEDGGRLLLPLPDMPSLCRHLLDGVAGTWACTIDSLRKGPLGWQVEAGGQRVGGLFDALVLALPPAQAAPLLMPHRLDWARHASVAPMQPCWTLIGVAEDPGPAPQAAPDWDLAHLPTGLLAWVLRNDARPGRARVPGQAHWVAHARAGWSRRHLEQPAAWVQQQMQAALAESLGRAVEWQHCLVHRWRYAAPQLVTLASAGHGWWDPVQRLGVCGDFLGGSGSSGIEGAWLSARSVAAALLQSVADPGGASAASSAPRPTGRAVAHAR